jgi:hypothetical protein
MFVSSVMVRRLYRAGFSKKSVQASLLAVAISGPAG